MSKKAAVAFFWVALEGLGEAEGEAVPLPGAVGEGAMVPAGAEPEAEGAKEEAAEVATAEGAAEAIFDIM